MSTHVSCYYHIFFYAQKCEIHLHVMAV
jgi:hypothetical protein